MAGRDQRGSLGHTATDGGVAVPLSLGPGVVRQLFDANPAAVLLLDTEERVLHANRALTDLTGFEVNADLKRRAFDVLLPRRFRRVARRLIQRVLDGRSPWATVLPLLRRDGSTIDVRWRGIVIADIGAGLPGVLVVGEDVTEARRQEGQLKFTQATVDRAADAIYWLRDDARLIYANDTACRMLGYTRGELLGSKVFDLDVELSPEGWRESWDRLRRKGAMTIESQHRAKDGRVFPVEVIGNFVRSGGQGYVCASVRDITSRKLAEQALRESEERLELALRGAGLGLWDWDITTGVVRRNERWAEMLGYTLGEIEPSLEAWMERVHPDDREGVKARLAAHLEGETPFYDSVYRLRAKSGTWLWLHDRGQVIERNGDGKPLRAAGTHLDITDRRRAKEELARTQALLRAAVEQVPAGILIADAPDVRIRLANAAALGIRGAADHTLTDIPLAHHPGSWQTYHPDGTPCLPEELPLSRAVLNGEIVENEEVLIRRPTGEDRWVLASASPVYDAEGQIVAGVVVFPDVTDRKAAEKEQRALEAKVREAQKYESLGVLAGGIAHDFNNLLMGMLGHADLALGKLPSDSPLRGHLDGIATAASRAADLCGQLLAYSGRGRVVIASLDLHELIREMGHLLEVSVAKGVRIEYEFADELPTVRADATQLRQVIMNLITNASDALGSAGGKMYVRTQVRDIPQDDLPRLARPESMKPGPHVILEVADDGGGMDRATLSRIFDPFFTTKFTGRGLGLPAVLGIVRSHNGGIDVRSLPSAGTTFRVLLPAGSGSPDIAAANHGGNQVEVEGAGTILVIDDEAAVRDVFAQFLLSAGFEVLEAEDGLDGIAQFQKHAREIRAVVLDMTMPRMDGVQAFRALREISPRIRVVLTSGFTEEELAVRFGRDAPDGFVQKPCRARDLLAELSAVLGA